MKDMQVVVQKNGRLIVYEGGDPIANLGNGDPLQDEFMHQQLKIFCTDTQNFKIRCFLDFNVLFAGINILQSGDLLEIHVNKYERGDVRITGNAQAGERKVESML